jgi:hypothetical protein
MLATLMLEDSREHILESSDACNTEARRLMLEQPKPSTLNHEHKSSHGDNTEAREHILESSHACNTEAREHILESSHADNTDARRRMLDDEC